MQTGAIEILIEGISPQETERLRHILHVLIGSGGLNIHNGRTILHWSDDVLQLVESEAALWRRSKSPPPSQEGRISIKPAAAQTVTNGGTMK
jgi:hypothetical protein